MGIKNISGTGYDNHFEPFEQIIKIGELNVQIKLRTEENQSS
jgi:hypothetical protein